MNITSLRHMRRHHWANQLLLAGATVAEMARQVKTPRTHLSALLSGSKGIGDQLAAKIEAAYGKPAGWLDRPISSEPTDALTVREAAGIYSADPKTLAHAVSHAAGIVPPKTMVWEDLVREKIEGQFVLAVRGEALMPTYPPGQLGIWQACDHTAPNPGQAVLIQLPGSDFELRFYERRGPSWAGVSQRVGHAELQPQRDGATIVARLRYLDLG